MPRSSSTSSNSNPGSKRILGRAMATILALPLTPISKAKLGLLLFKKRASSAARRRCCYNYKPFRHYNYAYVGEYQFSPSHSPLLPAPPGPPGVTAWRRARAAAKRRRSRARVILASLFCGGDELDVAVLDGLQPRRGDGDRDQLVLAPALEWGRERDDDAYAYNNDDGDEEEEEEEAEVVVDYGEEGDEEVDGRAERFIQRFYEEMRLQRQRSLVQRRL
ncbi:uncharacterized protein LOC8061359 [Sorghum bicolor]|uniref:Uncharacterized protein n=1 Tax=Sorghum bicolor TaxID=4558 RepID=C5XQU0_SORBI|nr:uncharacterized protein LOC8061359 [Sorghum bicolor]EES00365.1 hypothetical protein SORBI_3003G084100 [Sorghum bicolor]|eukprot:XP_002455245.1 uncharacterized protein LOC8061359 [Sorghum bicolor]